MHVPNTPIHQPLKFIAKVNDLDVETEYVDPNGEAKVNAGFYSENLTLVLI